jgi:MarR family transcriptional repressor of emrRAB
MAVAVVRSGDITDEPESFETVAREHVAAVVDDDDLDAFLVHFLLTRVSNRIATDLERSVYRPAAHTAASFRVLFTLWSVGTLSQKDLAHLAGVTPPSMSAVLKSLESRSLIERSRSTRDQRLVDVTLSERGKEEIENLYRAHHERERSWFDALDPAAKQATIDALRTLIRHRPARAPTSHRTID